jgi:hypothetical protein
MTAGELSERKLDVPDKRQRVGSYVVILPGGPGQPLVKLPEGDRAVKKIKNVPAQVRRSYRIGGHVYQANAPS